jgi:ribosomal protein S18 acetylase RimI-like enzyme
MPFTISRAQFRDYAAIEKLFDASLSANRGGFIQNPFRDRGIGHYIDDIIARGGDFYALHHDNKLIGMGGISPIADKPGWVELCRLHVDASYQGLKLGKKLANHLTQRAQHLGFTHVDLHVTTTQKTAIGLYEKMGFQKGPFVTYTAMDGPNRRVFPTQHMYLELPKKTICQGCMLGRLGRCGNRATERAA